VPPSPEADLLPAEFDRFWSQVRALPPRQAQAVALHYLEDRPVREVAELMGCSEGTAKGPVAPGAAAAGSAAGRRGGRRMSGHDPVDRLGRRAAAAVVDAAHPRVGGAPDPDELRAAYGRRRMRQRVSAGVAATAAVAVLVLGATGLLPDRVGLWIDDVIGDPSGPEQDGAAPTGPSEWPLGFVTADRQGVLLVPFDPRLHRLSLPHDPRP
jgi:hypothetical protein